MSTLTISNFINSKVNNNPVLKERMIQMLNFSNWEDLEAINLIFPFLTSYNSELILLTYTEQDILRTPTSLEYRKGVFNNLGGWMKTVYSLYPKNINNEELNQERIRLFTVVRQACISKITIIRNTTVSSNITIKVSESELLNQQAQQILEMQAQIQKLKDENKKLECNVDLLHRGRKSLNIFIESQNNENVDWKCLWDKVENDNKVINNYFNNNN